jgi:hypothetical protein
MPTRTVTGMPRPSLDEPRISRLAERKALRERFWAAAPEMPTQLRDKPVREKKLARPPNNHKPVEEAERLPALPVPPASALPEELPKSYGETRVVAMAVNPYLVHIYWDLDPKEALLRKALRAAVGCLRFSDTTRGQSPSSFDVNVDLAAGNWYVQLWSPERRYWVELGVNRPGGKFVPLARSNVVETPRAWPMAEVKERFARIEQTPEARLGASGRNGSGAWSVSAASPDRPTPAEAASPIDAAEVLRRKMNELYALRRQEQPVPDAVAAADAALQTLPSRPDQPRDLTSLAEHQFSPGFSSSRLNRERAKKRTG